MKVSLIVLTVLGLTFSMNLFAEGEAKLGYDPHKEVQGAIDNQLFKKDDFLKTLAMLEKDKTISTDQAKQLRELLSKMSESDFNNLLKSKAMSLMNTNSKTSAAHAESPEDGLNPELILTELMMKVQKSK